MAIDLVAKRKAIAIRHAGMQEHNDYWKEQSPPLSERPVAFQCDDEIVVIGDDVSAVYAGLEKFASAALPDWEKVTNEPTKVMAVSRVKRLLAAPPPDELRVGTQVWNCYAAALKEVGVEVCVSDGSQE